MLIATINDRMKHPLIISIIEEYHNKDLIAATYERMVITWQDPKDKKTTEDWENRATEIQDLTNQLFDVLYLSFTLLDRLEDVNKEIIKNGEKNLIKNIYCDNWKLKKIVEVEI